MKKLNTVSKNKTWSLVSLRTSVPYNIIQAYAPTNNTEEAKVEWCYEDLQDLLELTPK